MSDSIKKLSDLLRRIGVVPDISPERIAPSSIYDPVYRAVIAGIVMRTCGVEREGRSISLNESKLKLFQFVAIHSSLLETLRAWVAEHKKGRQPSLDNWGQFPRGYVTDSLHDKTIAYLVATAQLERSGKDLILPTSSDRRKTFLWMAMEAADRWESFAMERQALLELKKMPITLKMLGA